MATKVVAKNGEPTENLPADVIKIIVVGERKCGKSKFIEAFANRQGNVAGSIESRDYSRVYQCEYLVDGVPKNVKIYEIFGAAADFVDMITRDKFDANAIIFMYAIDDPLSFQEVNLKWITILEEKCVWTGQPSALVANKKDLRGDQQAIERLAQDNQIPVSYHEGESLQLDKEIKRFFEVSSIDEADLGIHEAFDFAITSGAQNPPIEFGVL